MEKDQEQELGAGEDAKNEPAYAFDAGDIVTLKQGDPPHFQAGDAGVVWGIYAFSPPVYETTFCNRSGYVEERMFQEEEVNKVSEVTQVHLPDKLQEFRQWILGKDA